MRSNDTLTLSTKSDARIPRSSSGERSGIERSLTNVFFQEVKIIGCIISTNVIKIDPGKIPI